MDKKREILVVKRNILFEQGAFQGFIPLEYNNFIPNILNNIEYKERNDELEKNSYYLQIIPYVWLVNPKTKNIFVYKRAVGKGDYKEKRHIDRYSAGVGGHIDRDTEENIKNPIIAAANRELREEVKMKNYPETKFIGYINDDSDIYQMVHFGVVAIAETEEEDILPDDGMKSGKFYSIDEFDNEIKTGLNEVENWTKISWPFVKEYLQKL